jgi:hypothetical protein
VAVDPATSRPVPVPGTLRQAVARFEGTDFQST